MSENGSGEQPDGSVGRYVRERWGTAEPAGRSFGRRRRGSDDDAARPAATTTDRDDDGGEAPARVPSAAERAASAPAPGRAAVGTRTQPTGSAWGSEVPEIDDDLVDEIDPSTPPHGLDLSALRTRDDTSSPPAAPPAGDEARPDGRHHTDAGRRDDRAYDVGPDDTGLYRSGGSAPESWWPGPAGGTDDPDGEVLWRRPDTDAPDDDPSTGAEVDAGERGSDRGPDAPVHDAGTPPAGSGNDTGAPAVAFAPDTGTATASGRDRGVGPPARGADGEPPTGGRESAGTGEPAGIAARTEAGRAARGARGSADRPWRTSWDRDAAEKTTRESDPVRTRPGPDSGTRRPRWTAPEAVEARSGQHRRADGAHGGLELAPSRSRHERRPPASGWRRLLYLLTGGLVNAGESPAELHRRELVSRLNRPLISAHKIAMLSLKGGVGKTTVTATLGATFASHRGDRVVAVDANPDRGTLSQKIPLETTATVRHLLRDAGRVRRYSDVRAYTSQGVSRLEVLASEQDPAVSEAFSEDDYRRAVDLLEHFYNLVLTDCGTGLMHSAMYGVLGMADQLVVVSSGSIDGARSASATLDWLDAHGYGSLVRNAVVVINTVYRRTGGGVDLDRVAEHFAGRCRAVVRLPFDPHLEEGAEIDLDRLEEPTRTALLELAAAVADGFPV
ncbi:AAA family ATPase [Pseudonocardia nematodicida]|uniref:nucleotide-binding protein n=1 Tax=Pseudonocardia nematodicida TaxID=1206997 RepID=UPI00360C6992